MTIERHYEATLISLEQELDGFLGAAFIELDEGRSLAAHSVQTSFEPSLVGAAGRAAIKAQLELVESLDDASVLEEVIVATSRHIYVYQPISPYVFLYAAANRDETNPALVRAVVKRYSEKYSLSDTLSAFAPGMVANS